MKSTKEFLGRKVTYAIEVHSFKCLSAPFHTRLEKPKLTFRSAPQDLVDIKGLGTNGSGHVTHNLSLD